MQGVVEVDGAELRYIREGEGQPVVVVGVSNHYANAFEDELRDRFELVFAESRHFTPSYQPREEELGSITLETLADDLEEVRSHLGFDHWVVLGQSFQAQIALAYAAKYPDRTSRLVLVAGVPYAFSEFADVAESFWAEHASPDRKTAHDANRAAIESALADAPSSRKFAVNYIGDAARFWVNPSFDATPLWQGVETSPVFDHLIAKIPSRDQVRGMLEHLKMPTLLILGKLDYAVPHIVWEELIHDLPHLTYVLLEHNSHNPYVELPEEFNAVLTQWLEHQMEPSNR
jgi:proline iminopeptidase